MPNSRLRPRVNCNSVSLPIAIQRSRRLLRGYRSAEYTRKEEHLCRLLSETSMKGFSRLLRPQIRPRVKCIGASDPKGSGSGSNGSRHNLPADWQHIAIGDLIVAQEGIEDGWYEAIVMDISGEMLTLRWRDYPRERKFSRHRHRIGLLFPNPKSDTKSETPNKSTSKAGKPGAASKSDTEHALPRTWDEIDVGALVLARDEGPFHAWWEAVRSNEPANHSNSSGAITVY